MSLLPLRSGTGCSPNGGRRWGWTRSPRPRPRAGRLFTCTPAVSAAASRLASPRPSSTAGRTAGERPGCCGCRPVPGSGRPAGEADGRGAPGVPGRRPGLRPARPRLRRGALRGERLRPSAPQPGPVPLALAPVAISGPPGPDRVRRDGRARLARSPAAEPVRSHRVQLRRGGPRTVQPARQAVAPRGPPGPGWLAGIDHAGAGGQASGGLPDRLLRPVGPGHVRVLPWPPRTVDKERPPRRGRVRRLPGEPRPWPVARVLGFPAGTERERLDAPPRVEDERAPAVPASPRRTGGPPFLALVQQGRYARGGQHGRERPHVLRRQPGVLLVAAALQDVLHFQAEPGGQPPQVDVLLHRRAARPDPCRRPSRRCCLGEATPVPCHPGAAQRLLPASPAQNLPACEQLFDLPDVRDDRAARVSRSWLYTQPDISSQIRRLRQSTSSAGSAGAIPAGQRPTDASLNARLAAALERNKQLAEDNARLRRQLAHALGDQRSARTRSGNDPES